MQFDPLAPEFARDPYPIYDALRSTSPIFFSADLKMWFASAYDDVAALLRDRRLGRAFDRAEANLPPKNPAYAPFSKLSEHSMFDKEPPDHTRLRSLVHKVFTPRRVENMRAQIETITSDLIDAVQPQGQMDLLEDFAVPLPVTVIAALLGVPDEDRHLLRPWSRDIVAMYELNHTPEAAERAIQAAIDFSDYLRQLARQRKRAPQDDLISALATVEEAGDVLSEDELISTCVLLLNAGHEATVNVIGNGMWALFQNPDQLRLLRDQPATTKTAVEEMMRYDTPLQLFRRWILEDIDYKGFAFKRGQEIALLFGAANRDPAQFEQPNRLDITRADNAHISFSLGIHYCLGAPLARLELQVAIAELMRRLPNMRLSETPEYRPGYVIRGLKSLQVEF
ncbi:MAG: cytochrome P450 [Chloroflexi bacterium]|nr:cytochrome P450 [Chloroflexota bacterium]